MLLLVHTRLMKTLYLDTRRHLSHSSIFGMTKQLLNLKVTPEHTELLRLEEEAKQQGLGLWDMSPRSVDAAIRNLPPSAVGDPNNLDAMGLLATNKGKTMEAIVEQVRDGSSLRVYLLPEFQFVQMFVAGIQAPSMGQRTTQEPTITPDVPSDETNGETNGESRGPLTSTQRISASSAYNEVSPDAFGREAKHFTEICVLNRDVRIVLEGVDKFSNLIGSVYYSDGESAKDLAMELIENGYAKYVEWSASMMEDEARRKLKTAELLAKKTKLRVWTNYVPPATNSKAILDNFTERAWFFNTIDIMTGPKGSQENATENTQRKSTETTDKLHSVNPTERE